MKSVCVVRLMLLGLFSSAEVASAQTSAAAIPINGADTGRTFDGIGGLSAGASSRLLIDYPEKQRSEILDYLFKPNFGAALQINKVEIGGDTNSTDGSEPSHMRTPDDQNYYRGYEWWFMEESKKRNPKVKLYGLEWGTPNWINPTGDHVWTDNNIKYLINWIEHAKSDHGLTIDYIGGRNERSHNKEWSEKFREALDSSGHHDVKFVSDDDGSMNWIVGQEADSDPKFSASFEIIGQHYPWIPPSPATTPQAAAWKASVHTGKPIWATEIGSVSYDQYAGRMARLVNQGYIDGKITAYINWATIWSVYSNLPFDGCGLMLANEPWSGHYVVGPTIWAVAHTTQFAQPGWQYLDHACGHFAGGGSYVTLRAPNHQDYSIIIETIDAKAPQTATYSTSGGLSTGVLHLWRSNLSSFKDEDWFVQQPDITPQNGTFSLTFEPGCVYSLTTTSGQSKGETTPPPSASLPLPYRENFQGYAVGQTPKLFSDQQGTFEIASAEGGRTGNCLRQVISARPIEWNWENDPATLIGGPDWQNYRVSSDVLLEQPGYVDLIGRMEKGTSNSDTLNGYHLRLTDTGHWSLLIRTDEHEQKLTKVLASGDLASAAGVGHWHTLALLFYANEITVTIDGTEVASRVTDDTYSQGLSGYEVSSWQNAEFMNFEAVPGPSSDLNLDHATAVATSFQPGYEPANAITKNASSYWYSQKAPPQSITIDLGQIASVRGLRYLPRQNSWGRITEYNIYVSVDGQSFSKVATGTWPNDNPNRKFFAEVPARYVRLEAVKGDGDLASAARIGIVGTFSK